MPESSQTTVGYFSRVVMAHPDFSYLMAHPASPHARAGAHGLSFNRKSALASL